MGKKKYRLKGYSGSKNFSGFNVPIPAPQMDWVELRKAKMRCENECLLFHELPGGCGLHKIPSMNCGMFMTQRQKVKV